MTVMPVLLSLNVGLPKNVAWQGKTVYTGVWKHPMGGPAMVRRLNACDVPTRWSCLAGVCHTCTAPLLSGNITYSPAPLETPADGGVLICCARPSGDIVLDM